MKANSRNSLQARQDQCAPPPTPGWQIGRACKTDAAAPALQTATPAAWSGRRCRESPRVVVIGCRHQIGIEHRHPQRSVLDAKRVNFNRLIVLHRLSNLPQVCAKALAVKLPLQYLRESRLRSRSAGSSARPISRIVNREGRFIQIALEFKSSLADEACILWVVAYGRQLLAAVRLSGLRPRFT